MPKRPDFSSDLVTIGLFAPLVIAARLQTLGLEALRPTASGRREALRMTSEKPLAVIEGMVAAQTSAFDSSVKLWSDLALSANTFLLTAPALSLAAASGPARRRVRQNARRLTGV
ncbi:MAG: hypothetical protein H0T75_24280 [Rhizobiales bacterium]|nr:hypothetical protein [Hyphomicrobiales bacterium]